MRDILIWLGFHVKHSWGVPLKDDGVWYLPCFECGKMKPMTVDLEVK